MTKALPLGHIFLLVCCCGATLPAGLETEWVDAQAWLERYRLPLADIARHYGLEADCVLPLAAPELLRYSRYRDFLENKALQTLYVRGGRERADFSIGPFQMKPSFVEDVERSLRHSPALWAKYARLFPYRHLAEAPARRRARLAAMQDYRFQMALLCAAYDCMELRFARPFADADELTHFYATAYNYGFLRPEADIAAHAGVAAFPEGPGLPGQWPYGRFAVLFRHHLLNNF